MRIFFILLLSLPLFAKTILYGDIDHDGRDESMELISSGQTDMGSFYQLIVKDDNGRVLWRARKSLNTNNRYSFFEAHHGISMPEILVDIDQDGYMELIAPEPQSDVSPTYYRKLKWIAKRFRIMPSQALMMERGNVLRWKNSKDYEGVWVSSFVGMQRGLIKVNITSYIKGEYKSGVALLEPTRNGARVVEWIKALRSGYDNQDNRPKENESYTPKDEGMSNQVDLNLKLLVTYSPKAKAKLESSGEKLIASLILDQYGAKYMEVEGVATRDITFDTQHDIYLKKLTFKQAQYDPSKRYKLTVSIFSARKVFDANILECHSKTMQADFEFQSIQNSTLEYRCKLIGEEYSSTIKSEPINSKLKEKSNQKVKIQDPLKDFDINTLFDR